MSFIIKKSKILKSVAMLLLVAICTTSCGKLTNQSQDNSKIFTVNPDNKEAQSFNIQLGNISDEKSAEVAVDSFMTYMGTRFAEPTKASMRLMHVGMDDGMEMPTSNTEFLKSAFNMKLMAAQEFRARSNKKTGTRLQEDSGSQLMTQEEIADQINSKSRDLKTTPEEIKALQADIRKALPNLAANPDDERMAPLECAVITWVFMTGDANLLEFCYRR